ncbi:integrase catalytic domain-containing protein [Trichonephila clavipes]|nr:integrase catalytic domain-containing protein [Trichonephila clavipes]
MWSYTNIQLTLTYGTTCAPYLATQTIQQLARDEGEHYPLAASVTIRDIYMDDILTEWDEPLSNPIAKELNDFVSTLPDIQNIHVPRLVIGKGRIIIHGFADASTAALLKCSVSELVSELILTSLCSATRGLLATDHVILNHGQVTWTTPELAPPLLTTTPHQREDVSALDRFNVHRCPTRRVFSGTGIELMTCLPWLDTLTTGLPQPPLTCSIDLRRGCIYKTLVQQIPCCTGETNHYPSFEIVCLCVIVTAPGKDDLSKLSNNYTKLLHILSYIFRFLHNSRNPSVKRSGQLDYSEVNEAELCLIKNLQASVFQEEIEFLTKGGCNSKKASMAVHLEIVSDLTTDAFLATLKRFVARRGKYATISSDNAKNFVGANRELKRDFMPPRAPNFGGLWEAGVKSFKFYLKTAVGNLKMTLEEYLTTITQTEGILNSRPITPLSEDIDDLEVLTLGHFLIGRLITSISEPNLLNKSENTLSRWQKLTKIVQHIWTKSSRDYLNNLLQRSKWQFHKDNVKLNTMVLIRDDNLPVNKWSLGRITKRFPCTDGKVRVVEIKTDKGNIKRSIGNVCALPLDN